MTDSEVRLVKLSVLKELAAKRVPRGDDIHPEYTKGFIEMQSKIKFEIQRLKKLEANAKG